MEHHREPRDVPPAAGDRFARESFTFRRMTPKQIWALGAAAIGGFIVALIVT